MPLNVLVWDCDNQRTLSSWNCYANGVKAATISPDGKTVITLDTKRIVRFWDAETGAQAAPPMRIETEPLHQMRYSSDGCYLLYAAGDSVGVWDIRKREEEFVLTGHSNSVSRIIVGPIGNIVATLSHDLTVRLWDISTGALLHTLIGHATLPSSGEFSPDGRLLATGSTDGRAFVWHTATGQLLLELDDFDGVLADVYFHDSDTLVGLGEKRAGGNHDAQVGIWSAKNVTLPTDAPD